MSQPAQVINHCSSLRLSSHCCGHSPPAPSTRATLVQMLQPVTAGRTLEKKDVQKQNGHQKERGGEKGVFRELTTDAAVPPPRYSGLNRSKQQRGLCFIFWLTDLRALNEIFQTISLDISELDLPLMLLGFHSR